MLLPLPPLPPPPSIVSHCSRVVAMYLVFPVLLPLAVVVLWVYGTVFHSTKKALLRWSDLAELFAVVQQATRNPITADKNVFQDPSLLHRIYQQSSAQHYLPDPLQEQHILEWQAREGLCALATLQSILQSFLFYQQQFTLSQQDLALLLSTVRGNSPEQFCAAIDKLNYSLQPKNNNNNIPPKWHWETTLFRCDPTKISYTKFIQTLQTTLEQPHNRVAVNFLRPALVGFALPWYWWPMSPVTLFLGLLGGHWSVVLGMIPHPNNSQPQQEPLVAIFDVNPKYGGTYLVPARRLYQAIAAKDIVTGKSRALVFVTLVDDNTLFDKRDKDD